MNLRTITLGAALVLSAPHLRAEEGSQEPKYYCSRYESFITFHRDSVFKEFGVEFPTSKGSRTLSSNVARSVLNTKWCGTAALFCIEEISASQGTRGSTLVYAVPRVASAGEEYSIAGIKFSVRAFVPLIGRPPAVVVTAVPPEGERRSRYKMYVEQGIGIRGLYFERLVSMQPAGFEYQHVTCSLMSERGLFAGVAIGASPTPDKSRLD